MIIDRFSRKAVLIGADLFQAGLVLMLLGPQGTPIRSLPDWPQATPSSIPPCVP
jgi:hypothetical protein